MLSPWFPRRLALLWPLLLVMGFATLGVAQTTPHTYLFCFWNVENLFDDRDDGLKKEPDKTYDHWFANDKEALKHKLSKIASVLLEMNGGKGPDVIALAEVESYRAAELVQQTLNARIKDPALRYPNVVYKDPSGGRNIAPAIITRLKAEQDRAVLLGRRLRILKVPVEADGHTLIVVASHWKSRLPERGDPTGEAGREKYGDQIHGDYRAAHKANPKVDYLVCGDFNDDPSDQSVTDHLRATGKRATVLDRGEVPYLFNPFANLHEKGAGSHFFRKWHMFDQICLSPGMLDGQGWSYMEDSATVVNKIADDKGRPNRFGGPSDKRPFEVRGVSDHFPVLVRLRVQK
jgi:endonuclease/exonuclease/phosphatase family metal-dependent hydrolase